MKAALRLSVVVPAHNAASYIERALSALTASDLARAEWELIVVDDASSDETATIASKYADRVITTGENARGPAFARNRGAEIARGQSIAFVDADVIVKPDALSRMADRIEEDPARVAVFGAYDDEPDDTSLVSTYRNLLHHYTHVQTAGEVGTFWAGCGAVRASAFRAVGGFDENRYPRPQIEDIELGYRMRKQGTILLDPSIQGKHLKSWSVLKMMRTDFSDRAVPWTRLLLANRNDKAASNPSLGLRALAATAFAGLVPAFILLAILLRQPLLFIAAGISLAMVIALNVAFYSWIKRQGGASLVATAVPLHYGYHLLSAAAIPVGAARFLMSDGPGNTSTPTGSRFVPLASGEIGSRLIAFVATAYLARTLGASSFGLIAFGMAFVNQFGMALSVGIGEVGSREVAKDTGNAAAHASAGVSLRLIVASIAILAIVAMSFALRLDPQKRLMTWLFAFTLVPMAIDTGWVYKGLGSTTRVGKAMVLDQLTCLLLIVALVHGAAHQTRVPIIQMLGDIVGAAVLGIPLMRGQWRWPEKGKVRELASRSSLITASRILRMIVISFDTVLLGLLVTSREVGWYSAAYRIVFFVMAILYASHVAFLPEIARSAEDSRAMSSMMSKSIGLALSVTAPFVVGGYMLAPSVMRLVFGDGYVSGAGALKLLLVSLIFLAVHAATRSVFLALNRMGVEAIIIAIGVAVNVVMNFILIPRMGITGSAIAAVGGEVVTMVGALSAVVAFGIRPDMRPWIPAIVSSALLAAEIYLIADATPVIVTIILGAIVYTLSIVALTVISRRRHNLLLAEA